MAIDLKLVTSVNMKCPEMAIATASTWFGRDYRMMFSEEWDFNFERNKAEDFASSGNSIKLTKKDTRELLKDYHGVEVSGIHYESASNILEIAETELSQNKPIAIGFDQFYLPWSSSSKKSDNQRYKGFIMLVGIDRNEDGVYCLDVHGSKKIGFIPMDNFREGCYTDSKLMKFNVLENYKSPDIHEYFDMLFSKIDNGTESIFKRMRQYAEYIYHLDEISFEISGSSELSIVKSFNEIGNSRNHYALTLSYLSEITEEASFEEISLLFKVFASKWHVLASVVTKAYYSTQLRDNLRDKIFQHIIELSRMEEEAKGLLENVAQRQRNMNRNNFMRKHQLTDNIRMESLDITDYFNNRAFSENKINEEKADFDGFGNFLILGKVNLVDEEINNLHVTVNEYKLDNIICKGQRIDIPPHNNYNAIAFLGCSDTGYFADKFVVQFSDGSKEEFVVGLSEYRFPVAQYGEKVIDAGKRIKISEIDNDELNFYLFSTTRILNNNKEITTIILPDCPNMHIFSIAVGSICSRS